MLTHANYKHHTYIAAAGVTYGGGLTAGDVVTKDNLPAGAVVVVDLANRLITSAAGLAAVDRFKLIQSRAGEDLRVSPIVAKGSLDDTMNTFRVSDAVHAPAVQQSTVIGFNQLTLGSAFTPSDATHYFVLIEKEDNNEVNRQRYADSITGDYETDNNATDQELFLALADSIFQNTLLEAGEPKYIRVSTVMGDDGVGSAPFAPTLGSALGTGASVGRGSKTVIFAGITTGVVAGDILALTETSNSVVDYYEVASVTVTGGDLYVTLATDYRGESESTAAGQVATAGGTAVWGIRLQGLENPFDVLRQRDYYTNRFIVKPRSADEPAGMEVTEEASAYEGVGVWQEAAMAEFLSEGFNGNRELVSSPPGARVKTVVEGSPYSLIQVHETASIMAMTSSSTGRYSARIYAELDDPTTASAQAATLATIFGATIV